MEINRLPKTREEARQTSSDRYFTGRPCKHGHLSPRTTNWGDCLECRKYNYRIREKSTRKRRKQRYYENQEQQQAESRAWYRANTQQAVETRRKYYEKNRDNIIAATKLWAKQNHETVLKWRRQYGKRNRYHEAKRRATLKRSIPLWYDHEQVRQVYQERLRIETMTGIPHHVDHIVPLTNDNVCGLHWSGNLRIISALENMSKGNKIISELVEFPSPL